MLSTEGARIKDSVTSVFSSAPTENSLNDLDTTKLTGSIGKPQNSIAPKAYEMNANPYQGTSLHQPDGTRKNGWFEKTLYKPSPGTGFSIWLAIPAIIALGLSGYLAFTSLTSSAVAGCSGEVFDCNSVLHSRWAVWFGIPVSLLAAATYISLIGALSLAQFGTAAQRNLMWMVVTTCSFSAGAAALWFTYLQFFVLEHLCVYCLAAHACGLILAISFLIKNPLGMDTSFRLGTLAMLGLVVVSVGQSIGKAPVTYTIEQFEPQYLNTQSVHPSREAELAPNLEGNSSEEIISAPANNDQIESSPADDSILEAPATDIIEAPTIEAPPSGTSDKQTSHQATPDQQTSIQFRSPEKKKSNLRYLWQWHRFSLTSIITFQDPAIQETADADDDSPTETNGNGAAASTTEKDPEASDSNNKPTVPKVDASPKPRLVPISGGTTKLYINQWPLVGSPDAKYVFVEMFDYMCPHCRKTHAMAIKGAQEKLAGDLAVLVLPLPLNTNCNDAIEQTGILFGESCEIAKLAVAVWRVDPGKFAEFHNWMFAGEQAPTYNAAKQHADSLVDHVKLDAELNSPIPAAYIKKHVAIYNKIGRGNVPKLMFPTTSIVGEFGSADALVELIQRQFPAEASAPK